MSETKPTGEQIRFRSANTGDHVLDTYLESAEIGGRTLTDLLDDLFDPSNNGVFRSDNFEFRFDSNKIQFRVGQFASSTAGFTDVTTFFAIKGTFSTSTAYNNFDVVTTSDKDVYIVHGLSTATTYSSESNFISSANTTKIVDVSEAKDWAIKTDGIVSSTGYSAKAWAIGGTGVDNQSSRGAAKDWATKTGGTVDGSDFSAKHYATTGNVAAVVGALSNINTVAGNSTNINTVAGISSNVTSVAGNSSNINSAVSNASNINAAVSNQTNINTVSGISSNITTVAGISSDVTTVAGANSNISALNASGVITNIGTVAGGISNVNTLAAISTDLTSLANSLEKTYVVTVANVGGQNVFVLDSVNNPAIEMFRGNTYIFDVSNGTVATHPLGFKDGSGNTWTSGVTTTGTAGQSGAKVTFEVPTNAPSSMVYYCITHGNAMGNSITVKDSNVSLVAGSIAGVNSVASNIANVNTVSGITSNLATVAGISSAVSTVSASNSNVTAVSGAITNINTVAGGLTNVNTVATNISSVNNFADVYRIASSAPNTSLNAGDLYFDTSTNTLKVYGASGWQNAGSSVNGTSDRFHYDITGTPNSVTGSDANGNTLAYDAGFIDVYVNGVRMSPQDVTISSGDTVTFTNALTAGDEVDIVAFGTFSVSNLNASQLTSGTVPIARLGSGTKNNTTFLRGDNTFATIDLSTLSPIAGSSSIVTTGALNAGSISSGFGNIDNGTSTLTTGNSDINGTLNVQGETTLQTHLNMGDGDIIKLGASADLQIYHDGSDSYIKDAGTGNLTLQGTNLNLYNSALNKLYLNATDGGSVDLYHNNSKKIETTSSGVTVTGDIGATTGTISTGIQLGNGTTDGFILVEGGTNTHNDLVFQSKPSNGGAIERMRIDSSGNVGIGNSSPASYYARELVISSANQGGITIVGGTSDTGQYIMFADGTSGSDRYRGYIQYDHSNNNMLFATDGGERIRIDSAGRVGIGSAPDTGVKLTVNGTIGTTNGTAALPTHSFYSDTNTGMYRPGVDNLGFTVGGQSKVFLSTTQFNVATPIVAQQGIKLGGNAVALDDYEEGTWTPSITAYTGTQPTVTFTGSATGFYNKVGRLVSVTFYMQNFTVSGTTSGIMVIAGLPFANNISSWNGGVLSHYNVTFARGSTGNMSLRTFGSNTMGILSSDNGGVWNWELNSIFGTGSSRYLAGSLTYQADS